MPGATPADLFWQSFGSRTTVHRGEALRTKIGPDLEAFLDALAHWTAYRRPEDRVAGAGNSEPWTLLHRFGRQMALHDVEPTGYVAASQSLVHALNAAAIELNAREIDGLLAACLEGYVAAGHESASKGLDRRLSTSWAPIDLSRSLVLWPVSGLVEAEPVLEAVDALGRHLLQTGSTSVILYGKNLECRDPSAARAFLSACRVAEMLGVRAFLVEVPDPILKAVPYPGFDLAPVDHFDSLEEALKQLLGRSPGKRRSRRGGR